MLKLTAVANIGATTSMSEDVRKFLVAGNPIAHSRSPQIHQAFADQFGLKLSYERALVGVGEFASFAGEFFASGGHGMNVTVPFKGDACQFAQHLTTDAQDALGVAVAIGHFLYWHGDRFSRPPLLSTGVRAAFVFDLQHFNFRRRCDHFFVHSPDAADATGVRLDAAEAAVVWRRRKVPGVKSLFSCAESCVLDR